MAYSSSTGSGDRPLTLGSVTFFSEECPERLAIGALEHEVVETKLFGGGKTTLGVGPQPKPVSWSGRFYENIDDRVAALTAMMTSGAEQSLSYGSQKWFCKVVDFIPHAAYHDTQYDITVVITRSATGTLTATSAVSPDAATASLAAGAASSMSSVLAIDPSVASLNTNVGVLTQTLPSLGTASPATIASFSAQLQTVLAQAQQYVATLSAIDPRFLSMNNVIDSLTLLNANISGVTKSSSISVTGGTIFDIAAQYCGDASKAFDIMAANGIYSPVLSNKIPTLLYIPQSLRSSTFRAAA